MSWAGLSSGVVLVPHPVFTVLCQLPTVPLTAETCTQPDCTTTGLSWISYGMTTSYVTGNSLKSSTEKQKTRLILYPHPLVTYEEHKEISNLEPSYIKGYMKRTFQNCSCNNGKSLPLFWQNFFSCCSVRALEILHLKYLLGSSNLSKKLSPLGCTEGCDRQAALVLEPVPAELSEKSSLQRLQGHHPIHRNERGICPSHRGAAFCAANRYHTSCITVCDIFKNSINLSSVPATLICVWQYLFPLKSPPALRTAVTRQNYTLHTLLK